MWVRKERSDGHEDALVAHLHNSVVESFLLEVTHGCRSVAHEAVVEVEEGAD